jgi:hypothetical protein
VPSVSVQLTSCGNASGLIATVKSSPGGEGGGNGGEGGVGGGGLGGGGLGGGGLGGGDEGGGCAANSPMPNVIVSEDANSPPDATTLPSTRRR